MIWLMEHQNSLHWTLDIFNKMLGESSALLWQQNQVSHNSFSYPMQIVLHCSWIPKRHYIMNHLHAHLFYWVKCANIKAEGNYLMLQIRTVCQSKILACSIKYVSYHFTMTMVVTKPQTRWRFNICKRDSRQSLSSSYACGDRNRKYKTWTFPNPLQVFFCLNLADPNHKIATIESKTEHKEMHSVKVSVLCRNIHTNIYSLDWVVNI